MTSPHLRISVGRTLWMLVMLAILVLAISPHAASFVPSAPTSMVNISSYYPAPTPGYMLNNSGGEITTLTLNATTQNYRWKGYVGNISGRFALTDGSLISLYDWPIQTLTGELFATRSSQNIDWDNIQCADNAFLLSEQTALNISTGAIDSIIPTFPTTTHKQFYVGPKKINANTCKATTLNVNGVKQSDKFQEVLLTDGNALIYASLLENRSVGFNGLQYDFQMIVAENALEEEQPNTAYYFYVELI